ncbi:MAG: DUF1952 domain-containing protein [Spirochaetes bacterium]|jgi:hypothetical protein|nr:DUF1952 domain-containing protein [Spirochaetota bacterium]
MELVHEFRDISPWVAEGYILSLAGSTREQQGFSGPGWRIAITELPTVDVGSLRFRRIRLTVSGDHDVVEQVWTELGPMFYRGGA